jgi:hypothetical protein
MTAFCNSETVSSPLMTFARRDEVKFITTILAALISASHSLRTSSLASGWPAFAKARFAFPSWPRENPACGGCAVVSAVSVASLTASSVAEVSFKDGGDKRLRCLETLLKARHCTIWVVKKPDIADIAYS